jgi:UDP-galactopyranose mutase
MIPYNAKLWRVPLQEITADWVSWSVPRPSLDEILNGALGINNRSFGYNPSFLYPKNGGISQIAEALSKHVDNLHLGIAATEICLKDRTVTFKDGSTCSFNNLVSTLPLPALIRIIRDLPDEVREAGRSLRYLSVYDVNLGVKRANISDKHWLYFPEKEFVFYRAGFPMNYAPNTVPEGCSSMYVEVSHLPNEHIPEAQLLDDVRAGLIRSGILRADDGIVAANVIDIRCAYVIHDLKRSEALEVIHPFLNGQRVFAIGRYGSWEYSSMESAILAGRDIAQTLRNQG